MSKKVEKEKQVDGTTGALPTGAVANPPKTRNMRAKIIRVFVVENGKANELFGPPEAFTTTADAWTWLAEVHAVPGHYYVGAGFEGTVKAVEVKPKVKVTF